MLRACWCWGIIACFLLQSAQAQDFDFELMTAEHVSIRGFDLKKLYSGPVRALAFGKDDKQFFSSGVDPRIHCWDFYAGTDKDRIGIPLPEDPNAPIPATNVLLYLRSGKILAAGNGGLIYLLDPVKKKLLVTFNENENIMQSVSFQTTSASITGNEENRGLTRDEIKKIKSSEMIEKGVGGVGSNAMSASVSNKAENRRAYILSMVASFDEKYILSGDSKGVITLWNNQQHSVHKLFYGHLKQVNALCFHPKSHAFFSGSDDKRIIEWKWEGASNKKAAKIIQSKYKAHKGKISALAISPDGKTLISGDDLGKIFLWSFRPSDTPVFELSGHKGRITKLAFTKNGQYLVSGSEDNTLRIWNVGKQQSIKVYAPEHYPITTFTLSPSEYFILSAGKTDLSSIRLWKLNAAIAEYEKTYGK